jgi:hypothetical protein
VVTVTDSYGSILILYIGAATFSSNQLLSCTHEAEWTLFETHYLSENLVMPGIEPGPLDLYPATLTNRLQGLSGEHVRRLLNDITHPVGAATLTLIL